MKQKIAWAPLLYIGGYHLFLMIVLPLYFLHRSVTGGMLAATAALVFISGMAITSGYHRLYSHSCYKTHPIIEVILLFFGTIATQGSALRWANDHRLHHSFIDTEKDPYSVKKGLWHAHILWMFFRTAPIDPKVVADLSRNQLIAHQHKYYVFWLIAVNVLVFLALGWLFHDFLGAFIFGWWVRTLVLHHTTWCINSLAHYVGTQNYSREHSAVDNYLISLLTYGEGYHNYHHTFAYDYRNGIRWYHFDPAKWFIWTLNKLGLASDLRKVNDYRIARQLMIQHKNELIQKFQGSTYVKKVIEVADRLTQKLHEIQSMADPDQLRSMKRKLKEDFREWKKVLKSIPRELTSDAPSQLC